MITDVVLTPALNRSNSWYSIDRSPLDPSPLSKIPLGSVRASGWLHHQLELMLDGMTGHLDGLSSFLAPDNGWLDSTNEGWEEQPYWLRGVYALGVLTGDKRISGLSQRWIEAVLRSVDDEGYFGPECLKGIRGNDGRVLTDLWPHMVMLDALTLHHEHTGDDRVMDLASRFFAYCRGLPDEHFIPRRADGFGEEIWQPFGDWKIGIQMKRAGDMLPHIFRHYALTGEEWLLDLARRFHHSVLPPSSEWLDEHVVHFTQRFAYPGLFGRLEDRDLGLARSEYWYAQHMGTWGRQPRGVFGADERIRPGKTDPRQGFETCGMVEFAKSFALLGRMTGRPVYADRTEDIILNHFPAAQTADLKGLHYLTAANMPQLDASESHDFFNPGRQICYSADLYRCCRHNVAMGWPGHVQNLWQATSDDGLAAWMYAGSEVTARVGTQGREVNIAERTDYPFSGKAEFHVSAAEQTRFPLYLRVPRWCRGFSVSVNGQDVHVHPAPGTYVRIENTWGHHDNVEITMPMEISTTLWPRTGSVTVDRGPLSYSVRIEEEWRRCGGSNEWPEWEVFPASPWNYALAPDETGAIGLQVAQEKTTADQPWTLENAPVLLRARARRVPSWSMTGETVDPVPCRPVEADEKAEEVSMIPLGCARLRISCLPVAGTTRARPQS